MKAMCRFTRQRGTRTFDEREKPPFIDILLHSSHPSLPLHCLHVDQYKHASVQIDTSVYTAGYKSTEPTQKSNPYAGWNHITMQVMMERDLREQKSILITIRLSNDHCCWEKLSSASSDMGIIVLL